MQDITKLCSDHLRIVSEKYGVKLKASHAHELVAAFFGYKSRAAMLADNQYPISNLSQAEFIVMAPNDFIEQRRKTLQKLSSELPDNYMLGEAFYEFLFAGEWWASRYRPFGNFEKLARYLVDNNDSYKNAFKFYRDVLMHHIVEVKDGKDGVTLTVLHAHAASTGEKIGNGQTTIMLHRVVGHIGYDKPQISVELWTGGARRSLDSMGVQP